MRLEYRMYLFGQGESPSMPTWRHQKFQPGPGLRCAISFDDEARRSSTCTRTSRWQLGARGADGVKILTSRHRDRRPGYHVLKFWALDRVS